MPDENPSPLTEADQNSLDHIFSCDPEKLTDEEILAACNGFRKMRAKWAEDEKTGKKFSRKPKPKKDDTIDLKDLDL